MRALDALRHIVEQSGCRPKDIARLTEQAPSTVKAALAGPGAPSVDQIIAIANALGYELALVDVREVLAYDACYLTSSAQKRYRKDRKRVASLEGPVVFDSDSLDLAALMAVQAKLKAGKRAKKGGKKAKGAKAASAKAAATSDAATAEAAPASEVSVRISDAHPNPNSAEYRPSVTLKPQHPMAAPAHPAQHFSMKEPRRAQDTGPIPRITVPDGCTPPSADAPDLPDMPAWAGAPLPLPRIPELGRQDAFGMPMPAMPYASAPMPGMPTMGGMPFSAPSFAPKR